ncbi:hypothetical protein COAQ111491_08150 [Comamonas aquatilis]
MNMQKTGSALLTTALMAAAGFTATAHAQEGAATPAPAAAAAQEPAAPAPSNVDAAAASAALLKRLQAIVAAADGKSKLAANNFTEEFLKQSPMDAVQKALASLHTGMGSCKTVARMQSGNPLATGVLLDCAKGYAPLELAVEAKAPYRVTAMMLRPPFWK